MGDHLIVVSVRDIEVGMGDLFHTGKSLSDDIIRVGTAEYQGIELLRVLLIEIEQVLQSGIGQVGDIAEGADLLIDVHDVLEGACGGKNADRVHWDRSPQLILYRNRSAQTSV